MDKKYILTFDCGTQSTRAMIFDNTGELCAFSKVEFEPYFSPQPGYAEQHPDLYWDKLCEASKLLKTKNPELFSKVMGVTMTTLRDTCINLDATMNPLRPAILWVDQRTAKCEKPFSPRSSAIFAVAGMTECATASRKASKANWISENEPDIWKRTYKYVMLSCYLTYKLTGRLVDSVASQVGHVPFDYKRLKWMGRSHYKWRIFGVEPAKLPALVNPGELLGTINPAASEATGIPCGLPLIATGGDKACETVGSGAIGDDVCAISYGTTSTIQITTERYVEPQQFLPAYPAVIPGLYNPEIEIYRGYWMITWFKEQFAAAEAAKAKELGTSTEAILDEQMQSIAPGADGLILQPYWGPGLKNPEAKGCIIGFSDSHTSAHMYRAIIEGIGYALREASDVLAKRASMHISRLTVSGGGASSDIVCQITSDIFGLPVFRAQTSETAGLGSAIIGFLGLGVFGDYRSAIGSMVRHTKVFNPDPYASSVYNRLYKEVYLSLYPKLKPLYQKIRDIYK